LQIRVFGRTSTHVPARGLTLYVKFQGDVVTEFKVVSFKEK
jgi:motility quorum-sensing regulator/GCU-specific mRNA interferase toxin